jgi:hypothetical protein
MNRPKTTARNKVRSIKNKTYMFWTNLIWTPVGTRAVRNAIENMASIKQTFNRNFMN